MSTKWSHYDEAYKAIFDAAQALTSIKTDLTKLEFTWNADGTLSTLKAFKGSEVLYTLAFTWNADGTLQSITRS